MTLLEFIIKNGWNKKYYYPYKDLWFYPIKEEKGKIRCIEMRGHKFTLFANSTQIFEVE